MRKILTNHVAWIFYSRRGITVHESISIYSDTPVYLPYLHLQSKSVLY